MDAPTVRFFGDQQARRWIPVWMERANWLIVGAVHVVAAAALSATIWHWMSVPDVGRAISWIVGTVLGIVGYCAVYLAWRRYSARLRRALATLEMSLDNRSIAFGAALPRRPLEDVNATWPATLGSPIPPQRVVFVSSPEGISLFDLATPPNRLVYVNWAEVETVDVARYVESGRWYSGIAVVLRSDRGAIVLQLRSTRGRLPNYLDENGIEELVSRVMIVGNR